MEVLSQVAAGPRIPYSQSDRFWGSYPSFAPSHQLDSFARFGPQPPPSPPYEMSHAQSSRSDPLGQEEKISLPPISDLLKFSRQERNERPAGRPEQAQQRPSLSPRTSRHEAASQRSPPRPTSPRVALHQAAREMQPPLTLQPPHNMTRIDPALFNDSRHGRSSQAPTSVQRPTLDTTSQHARQQVVSPYPLSAPLPSPYPEASPRSVVSSGPSYSTSHHDSHRPYTLPPPGPPTPRKSMADSPQAPYYHGLPLPARSQDDSHARNQHQALPSFTSSRSSVSPRLSRTLPSVNPSRWNPYPEPIHHVRQHSNASSESMAVAHAYLPPSPSSSLAQGQLGHGGFASTLQDRYQCSTCAKAFSRPSSLRIHTHSHTGEKPFVCPRDGCGKAFSVRSNMKRHERGCHIGLGMPVVGQSEHMLSHYHEAGSSNGSAGSAMGRDMDMDL